MSELSYAECQEMLAQLASGLPLSIVDSTRLLHEVARLRELQGRGKALVPMMEWEHDRLNDTVRVLVALPMADFHPSRPEFIARLSCVIQQTTATYLNFWDWLHRDKGEEDV